MNYQRIYDSLVSRGKNRVIEGYSERHHIIPKTVGGTNEPENFVRLTAEEHFLAHQLLCKIYPNNRGIAFAALMMCCGTNKQKRVNNKLFGWIRRKCAILSKSRKMSEETRRKLSACSKGRKFTEEQKRNLKKIVQNTSVLDERWVLSLIFAHESRGVNIKEYVKTHPYFKTVPWNNINHWLKIFKFKPNGRGKTLTLIASEPLTDEDEQKIVTLYQSGVGVFGIKRDFHKKITEKRIRGVLVKRGIQLRKVKDGVSISNLRRTGKL